LPFIALCPPRRNHSPPFAAHPIDHYDFNVFHKTDREYAVFTTATVHSLEHRPVKYSLGLPKIDVVFCEVRLPLAFIPLESIPAPSLDWVSSVCTICTHTERMVQPVSYTHANPVNKLD
jgi:hypothetical protein